MWYGGEQPLLPYESCSLISINLGNHIIFNDINWGQLDNTIGTACLFMNRVLDKSIFPIPECQEAMEMTRKIGIGIMGLHDMLIQLKLPYDSEAGRDIAKEVMRFINERAHHHSSILAETDGYYKGRINTSPQRRNANLTTIAPTGTLSMFADVSSGCEPYFSSMVYKTVMDGTTFAMPNKQLQSVLDEYKVATLDELPLEVKELFKGAGEIHWKDHILMQSVLQQHVDSSISKTINMPNDATVQDVKDAYELAYTTGCKGVTIYRDGSRDTQVLSTTKTKPSKGVTTEPVKADLPDKLHAVRYRVRVKNFKVYIIICEDDDGRPMEVFVKFPYQRDEGWNTLCRSISLSMRYGVPLTEIIKQLDKSVISINDMPSRLSKILKSYLNGKGKWKSSCPDCKADLIFTEGCEKCVACGYNKCG